METLKYIEIERNNLKFLDIGLMQNVPIKSTASPPIIRADHLRIFPAII
jgi:hypothetical protein